MPAPLNVENVLLQLREFLMVYMTQVIYYNGIYPENAFEQRKFLDLVILQSRVPALNEYLRGFANEVVSVLVEKEGGGKLHDLVVIVYEESSLHVVKRYIIGFGQFVPLAGQITSLDFLHKQSEVHLARINIPGFDWNEVYSSLRSLLFAHLEELKRTHELQELGYFFKLLLNVDNQVDLSGEQGQWVKLLSEEDTRKTKFVSLGEISTGVLSFDLHNEYII